MCGDEPKVGIVGQLTRHIKAIEMEAAVTAPTVADLQFDAGALKTLMAAYVDKDMGEAPAAAVAEMAAVEEGFVAPGPSLEEAHCPGDAAGDIGGDRGSDECSGDDSETGGATMRVALIMASQTKLLPKRPWPSLNGRSFERRS